LAFGFLFWDGIRTDQMQMSGGRLLAAGLDGGNNANRIPHPFPGKVLIP